MNHVPERNMFPEPQYKVYVSYNHSIEDQEYRNHFEEILMANQDVVIMKPAQIGNIDPNLDVETIRRKIRDEYLRDSAVTVVLIGSETWKRRHVDWEIRASVRKTQDSPGSGLLGIILPTYPRNDITKYNQYTIPPRLYDNIKCGFASIYDWDADPFIVQKWIHDAFERRNKLDPDNSRPSFVENLFGNAWHESGV
ncbi:MAG: TIR domain-containing protein [Nitrosomonas sp.]|nr:TIR domain-containing protein [Nitrosomonas sp.]